MIKLEAIRRKSVEEFAEFLLKVDKGDIMREICGLDICPDYAPGKDTGCQGNCYEAVVIWLQQEVNENE